MDIKTITADVAAACAQRWPDPADAALQQQQASALIAQLETLKSQLKQTKTEKQQCARDFGTIKASGGDLAAQKALMQQVSNAIEMLEQQRKSLEAQLLELFGAGQSGTAALPPRFCTPVSNNALPESSAALPEIDIIEIADTDADAWDAYVQAHPQSSLYHSYCWREIITRSFQHQSIYIAARSADGRICGVLPLIRLTSRLFGDFAVSLPFFNYGGPLADNDAISRRLLDYAAHSAQQLQLKHLEIRATHAISEWPARTDKVSMVLALPNNEAALDELIGSKVRAQIKRAPQENTHIAIGHIDLLDDFYRVFAINMRDLGTPVYAKAFFHNILSALPDHSHIVVVYLDGKPVSTAFLLGYRDMMEIPWASTLRSVNALNINMLLYRAVLGFCIERHYGFFDFGRSSKDSGTFRFKKQWGAVPVQHYWHYWLPNGGELPALNPDSPKFRFVIGCWQQLPVWITRLIGPAIVKNLP